MTANHTPRAAARAALLLAALSAAGCVLSEAKHEEIVAYPLDVSLAPPKGGTVLWQLAVEEPIAAEPLATSRVAVREADRGYGVLAGARWSERAPSLVQTALVRSFEDSGRMLGVGRASSGVRGDYVLLTELRAFEADYGPAGGAPAARVVLSVKLVRTERREVVAAAVLSERKDAKAGTTGAIVAAFEQAFEQILPKVRDWALAEGERDWQKKRD